MIPKNKPAWILKCSSPHFTSVNITSTDEQQVCSRLFPLSTSQNTGAIPNLGKEKFRMEERQSSRRQSLALQPALRSSSSYVHVTEKPLISDARLLFYFSQVTSTKIEQYFCSLSFQNDFFSQIILHNPSLFFLEIWYFMCETIGETNYSYF